jgi:hypothetical protein
MFGSFSVTGRIKNGKVIRQVQMLNLDHVGLGRHSGRRREPRPHESEGKAIEKKHHRKVKQRRGEKRRRDSPHFGPAIARG